MYVRTFIFFVALVSSFAVSYSAVAENETEVYHEINLLDGEDPCFRPCEPGKRMICRYNFNLEWYTTMSKACKNCPLNMTHCYNKDCIPADGVVRPILAINRQLPGPSINVCKGDVVVINVTNNLISESTTIHWHGHHQRDSPYMDGVPFLTQCPISPFSTYQYRFNVNNAGTHFWHSHSALQRGDGSFGTFVVRVPDVENLHRNLYDYDLREHTLLVIDWGHEFGLDKFTVHSHADGSNKPANLLVNGMGRYANFTDENGNNITTPIARIHVTKGKRYRIRIVNAEFLNCPTEISVDNHNITVISTDGTDIEPVEADSLVTYAGERFDFILNADQEIDNYWMNFVGMLDCGIQFTKAHQSIVVQYAGATDGGFPSTDPVYKLRGGKQINSMNEGMASENIIIPKLSAVIPDDGSLKEKPDFQYYVVYDFYGLDNPNYFRRPHYIFNEFHNKTVKRSSRAFTPQLNHISMKMAPFPILVERDQITDDLFCNKSTVAGMNCEKEYCECPHVVQIPLNSIVELVLVDEGKVFDANHPFHLHGYAFRVVAMDRVGKSVTEEEVRKLDEEGKIKRKLSKAPVKDTVTIPDGGYTIVRFNASNPGYWILHCHIEFHAEFGMAMVFKVGENSEMLPVPKDFPRCGNYVPLSANLAKQEDNQTGNASYQGISATLTFTCLIIGIKQLLTRF